MIKNIGYIRVSTDKQEDSLDVQKEAILKYCTFKGLEIDEFIINPDVSGGIPLKDRPGASKIFDAGVENVVVYKIDRAFRNVADALLTSDYFNSKGIIFHIINLQGINLDTSTATGRLIFTMLVSFAEHERGVTKERTRDGLAHRKNSGRRYSGNIPFGYKGVSAGVCNSKGKQMEDLVECEKEQDTIKSIKSLINDGVSYREIQRVVPNPRGGELSLATISKVANGGRG